MFYSKKTGGFYDPVIHKGIIPAGAKEITQAEHSALLESQAQGKVIQPDADGRPVALPVVTTLDQVKESKRAEIRALYEANANLPVIVGSVVYQGGFDSAIKLDAARRLAEAAGMTTVTFYDAINVAHVLTLAEALDIVLVVATAFQTALARKQTAMVKINDPSNTKAEIHSIAY